jgi:hypothetical protein
MFQMHSYNSCNEGLPEHYVPTVLKSESLSPWNPQGLSRAVQGMFYLYNEG